MFWELAIANRVPLQELIKECGKSTNQKCSSEVLFHPKVFKGCFSLTVLSFANKRDTCLKKDIKSG